MPSSHRPRVIIVLAVLLGALGAWPGAASADLSLTGATLDGATSVSSPPGGVMRARVTGNATNGQTWRGTEYRWGDNPWQCVNTDDRSGTDRTVELNVTAPGDPGDYNASFRARGTNACAGDESAERVLTNALNVTRPAANPNLPPRCGINVMLVLDRSGSIGTSGATEAVRNATRAFLAALSGTGAAVSIVDFSTRAEWRVPYTTVTAETIADVFEPYVRDEYNPEGWTNWEDAFDKVHEVNADPGTPRADLVVFVTDGDPTARNNPPGNPVTGLTEGAVSALLPAQTEADRVKQQGSHVFALGVGEAVTKPTSARRLTAVSGFDAYPGTDFGQADYTLVQNFADLAKALRAIAVELCESSVIVTKQVDEGDGVYRADAGWRFTASVETSPGGYTWLQPPPSGTGPRSRSTNDEGVATFQWETENSTATSRVSLEEEVKAGYDFVDASCTTNAYRRQRRRVVRRVQSTDPSFGVTVGPNQYVKCTVRNRIRPGTIEIEKSASPETGQEFPFSGSLGDFILVDGRRELASSRIFTDLAPGTYTVRELVPDNWEITGIVCSDPAGVVRAPGVAITIGPGDSVVCTFGDRRLDPPAPPPPFPPDPPGPPGPPTPPDPPPLPPSTELRVVKTAPRVARVGQRVRFRLTVRNTGSVAARRVQLADVPPAAVALAGLRSGTRARVVRGNAYWSLGRLAPGARRTVRGSVLIKAGTPGLKRNLVLATAANAELVSDRADTRVRGRRQAPPVTG
jgi:uncharacterized repeat protein (TIGR01451 family)